jgi:nicotinamide phosphoribosyltransferase
MFALHAKDSYKVGHIDQYPSGTTEIYSNLTARSGKYSNVKSEGILYIPLFQKFAVEYLIKEWNSTFFSQPKDKVVEKYQRRVSNLLKKEVNISHISALHDLHYLPVEIKQLPEGSFVPYNVPCMTIRNTLPDFYWVTNMLETVISCEFWQPITSATTYFYFRKLFIEYADKTGVSRDFTAYQGHDFSMRGMANRQAAASSGAAVLLAGSKGTDVLAAIDLVEDYYQADSDNEIIGESVDATEHSVMCCGSKDGEIDTLRRLLTETYPSGPISVVSDTWDFWKLVTEYLPELKDTILNRDGKLIIRPDSGDPVDIICGTNPYTMTDPGNELYYPQEKGLIECLWETFGGTINGKGYKVLNSKVGSIYGDSINYDRAERILKGLEAKGFASSNIVFGLGSYSFQGVTRDTHGFAIKATNAIINGVSTPIFKDPKTDNGTKKSAKGYLMVTQVGKEFQLVQQVDSKQEKYGCLKTVFKDGLIYDQDDLETIRERVESYYD